METHVEYSLQDLESQTDECVTPQNALKNVKVANVDDTGNDTDSAEKRKADAVERPLMGYQEESSATKKTKMELLKEIKLEKP